MFYTVYADFNGCAGQKFDSGDIGMTLSLANTDPWDKAERILLILEDSTYQCSDGNMDFVDQGHDYELICDNIGNFCFIFLVYFNFSDCSVDHFLFSDGLWLEWNSWGDCLGTCGVGVSQRTRLCSGAIRPGESKCVQPYHFHEEQSCPLNDCDLPQGTFLSKIQHSV